MVASHKKAGILTAAISGYPAYTLSSVPCTHWTVLSKCYSRIILFGDLNTCVYGCTMYSVPNFSNSPGLLRQEMSRTARNENGVPYRTGGVTSIP